MVGRCPCGGLMAPALRYEASRTVEVRCCWRCGLEDPPLYKRSRLERNGPEFLAGGACEGCGKAFCLRPDYPTQRFCGRLCQGRAAGFQKSQRRSA